MNPPIQIKSDPHAPARAQNIEELERAAAGARTLLQHYSSILTHTTRCDGSGLNPPNNELLIKSIQMLNGTVAYSDSLLFRLKNPHEPENSQNRTQSASTPPTVS